MQVHALLIDDLSADTLPGGAGQAVVHWIAVIGAVYALTYSSPAY